MPEAVDQQVGCPVARLDGHPVGDERARRQGTDPVQAACDGNRGRRREEGTAVHVRRVMERR